MPVPKGTVYGELEPGLLIDGIPHEDVTNPWDRYQILKDRKLRLPSDKLVNRVWKSLHDDLKECGTTDGDFKRINNYKKKQWKRHPHLGHLVVWHYAEQRARMKGGMFWFARHILRQRKLLRHVHHYHLCSYLEESLNKDERLHFRWHRASFKSTIVAYAAPLWVLGVDKRQSILLIQANDRDINSTMKRLRNTIASKPAVYALFPHLLPGKDPFTGQNVQWNDEGLTTQGKIDLADEEGGVERDYSIYGISVGSSATGWHPSMVIGDDLHTIANTQSPLMVQKVKDFWEDTTGPVLRSNSPIWLIDTPWTVDDLGSDIDRGEYGQYHSSIMPVKRELPEGKDGELVTRYMIPTEMIKAQLERDGESHLYVGDIGFDKDLEEQKREKMRTYFRFQAQMMCQPVPPGEVHFPEDGWRTWSDDDGKAPWKDMPGETDRERAAAWYDSLEIYAFWDPAVAQERQSDYTACGVVGLPPKGNRIYVLDYCYDKLPPRMGIEMVFQLYLPPFPGMPKFWRERPVWPTPDTDKELEAMRCWRPNFITTDKSVVEQAFKGGIEERQDRTGFVLPVYGSHTHKGRGKQDWILKCLDRYFMDGRIRVRAPLFKPSQFNNGRMEDISKKVQMEYDWFMRAGVNDDFLDGLAKVSYYWSSHFRPQVKQAPVVRSEAERMLEGFLRPATAAEVIDGFVEEGSPIPAGQTDSNDEFLEQLLNWGADQGYGFPGEELF